MGNRGRVAVGVLVGVLFAVPHTVATRTTGDARVIAGYALTIAFVVALAEFATGAIGRRGAGGAGGDRVAVRWVFAVASALLALDLAAKALSPYFALQRRPPPTVGLLVVVAGWLAVVPLARRRPAAAGRWCLVGLAGLVIGTRALVLAVSPFDRMTGDMLPVIDRALGELLAGRFPYRNYPPPMPYLPGMFLAYLPPKLLGLDIRWSNLAIDLAAAVALMAWAPGPRRPAEPEAGGTARPVVSVGRVVLPLLMLHPVWIYYSVNTQFAPSVLTTVLLGLAVAGGGPRRQAAALGLAVGTNQMLLAVGPVLAAHWLGRHGWRRAAELSAMAAGVFLAIVGPFLLWDPRAFVRVAFLERGVLPVELMAGRLTLSPLLARFLPVSGLIGPAIGVGAAAVAATRARRPASVVAAMAVGLCLALLTVPASFPQYFLPVLALAAIAAGGPAPADRDQASAVRQPSIRRSSASGRPPSAASTTT